MTDAERSAQFEIKQNIYRYSWSFDFEFARGIGACFTKDAIGEFENITAQGNREVVDELMRRRTENYADDELTMHVNTNILFRELSHASAVTTTYCMFYAKKSGAVEWEWRAGGYYGDEHLRTAEKWLIRRRRWMFGSRV